MQDPHYFPTTEQFRRDREAKEHARRAAGRHLVNSGLAITPSSVCRKCGRKIYNGNPAADPILTTCKDCLHS